MSNVTYLDLANYIFPEVTETIDDLEKRFPKRKTSLSVPNNYLTLKTLKNPMTK